MLHIRGASCFTFCSAKNLFLSLMYVRVCTEDSMNDFGVYELTSVPISQRLDTGH